MLLKLTPLLNKMKVLRIALYVLLTLLASPWVINHWCALGSWPIEFAIVLVVLGYPLVLQWYSKERYSWKLVIAAPFVSLAVTLTYFLWLHSKSFPRQFLNHSAIESVDRMKAIKQKLTPRGPSHTQ